MSLNKFMHPRNPYRAQKPNFKQLAKKYEKFGDHVTEDSSGVHIDFKKPECLRALTWALLKDDFDLDVSLPLDRLIPTVPLRLNYLLWIEDILKSSTNVRAIDIGAGASCIYGLLGARLNSWTFLATETDATNFEYAKKNVADNDFEGQITVVKVPEETVLYDVLSDTDERYDFCMCNPPFYGSNLEAWGMLTTRHDQRPEPSSVSTASPSESIVAGGEVDFVKRIIADSITLRDRIRVYTTMLGKKSSVAVIKEDLRRNGVTNIGQTEFCQGKTMRWGVGWSFEESIVFPKAPSKLQKAEKPRPPHVYDIPKESESLKGVEYTLQGITDKVIALVDELQIRHLNKEYTKYERQFDLIAVKNTWSHQRRKRRQQKQQTDTDQVRKSQAEHVGEPQAEQVGEPQAEPQSNVAESDCGNQRCGDSDGDYQQDCCVKDTRCHDRKLSETDSVKRKLDECDDHNSPENVQNSPKKSKLDDGECCTPARQFDDPEQCIGTAGQSLSDRSVTASPVKEQPAGNSEPLLKCILGIKVKSKHNISVEIQWVSGQNRQSLHQIMQYIRNRLS